jgi:hypothetical protein
MLLKFRIDFILTSFQDLSLKISRISKAGHFYKETVIVYLPLGNALLAMSCGF